MQCATGSNWTLNWNPVEYKLISNTIMNTLPCQFINSCNQIIFDNVQRISTPNPMWKHQYCSQNSTMHRLLHSTHINQIFYWWYTFDLGSLPASSWDSQCVNFWTEFDWLASLLSDTPKGMIFTYLACHACWSGAIHSQHWLFTVAGRPAAFAFHIVPQNGVLLFISFNSYLDCAKKGKMISGFCRYFGPSPLFRHFL